MEKDKKFVVRVRGIILFDDELLIVKHPHDTSFCALPGGHLEWGEDIKECLRREIIEELGVNPDIGRLLYINNFMDGDTKQSIEFFFEITNSHEYKNIDHLKKTHAYEIAEVCWIKPSDNIPLKPKSLWEDFKKGNILSDQVRYIHD
ncbi:MAG: NUDIX domain-containing protein [Candidatus Nomurabacteria bacterium]|nr:NUDIX domain-containing protein [Candidatus Nomurabacteria bacterium]